MSYTRDFLTLGEMLSDGRVEVGNFIIESDDATHASVVRSDVWHGMPDWVRKSIRVLGYFTSEDDAVEFLRNHNEGN